MIKTIIVDDEPLALDVLETYISQLPNVELVKKCTNAIEANEALKEFDIDLMFLDIQMPQITGVEFLKSLSNPPKVIFTTAYPDYALEGFELNASDYLLKPISLDRFMKAVNRVSQELELEKGESPMDSDEFFFVKADKKLIKVRFEDILYVEGLKDYVIIKRNDSRIITLQTMKSLEAKLPSSVFKRVHRSYIMNLNKINAVMGNMIEITEKGEKKHIPIGKNYREKLLEIINEKRL
jgi:DNA-binding LytR/AlgR family response regulator